MRRITLDTNVLAPGFTSQGSASARLIDLWRAGAYELILSEHVLEELARTLQDPYFAARLSRDDAAAIVTLLSTTATVTELAVAVHSMATHPEDDAVPATAISGQAAIPCTRDTQLLKLRSYQGVAILSPGELVARFEGESACKRLFQKTVRAPTSAALTPSPRNSCTPPPQSVHPPPAARVTAPGVLARYTPVRSRPRTCAKNPLGSPMRNLLGRLHARRLPELLRIAEAWSVPLYVESKGEVVGALYRAMTDPRTMRDVWDRLDPAERAMVTALTDASDEAVAPTVDELAAHLAVDAPDARETALRLYRIGILFREGDDEPLPIGVVPRLLLPRELALQVRRIQDEMAAGNLAQSPLRVLLELLDDAELEAAAKTWGLRTVPGVARRRDLAVRLLRLINDPTRVERVVRGRGRDAVAVWKIVSAAAGPVPLAEVAASAGLGGSDTVTVARLRAALAELEGALLVWHAYRRDGTRWLFVPAEIRSPGESQISVLPELVAVELESGLVPPWRHPDAVAWDLLTLLRIVSTPQTPVWEASQSPPRWLLRALAPRLWFGGKDGPPVGYLELLQALALAEGVLTIDEDLRPRRIAAGPHARGWRGSAFGAQTARLRERWLRLPRWVEGEPAGVVDVWGADWRGMRPRLLMALADPEIGLIPPRWATLESVALRLATRYPRLLGPSFTAATARLGGEAGAGVDEEEARAAALSDVIALELGGPFVWFALAETVDRPGQARAFRLTETGVALAKRQPGPAEDDAGASLAPLVVDPAGEITLRSPSPDRVWALTAFSELVDLGRQSHYRLTPGSLGAALAAGVELDQIERFLERGSRQSLPQDLAANLTIWARGFRRVGMRRAVILRPDDATERPALIQALVEAGWTAEPLGDLALLVSLAPEAAEVDRGEEALIGTLRAAGHAPRWATVSEDGTALTTAATPPVGKDSLPDGD